MTTLDVHGLGKSLAELVKLARTESEVVLVDGSRPVARVLPIPAGPVASTQVRTLGMHDGAFEVSDDFDAALPDEFWAGQSWGCCSTRTRSSGSTAVLPKLALRRLPPVAIPPTS